MNNKSVKKKILYTNTRVTLDLKLQPLDQPMIKLISSIRLTSWIISIVSLKLSIKDVYQGDKTIELGRSQSDGQEVS